MRYWWERERVADLGEGWSIGVNDCLDKREVLLVEPDGGYIVLPKAVVLKLAEVLKVKP